MYKNKTIDYLCIKLLVINYNDWYSYIVVF